MERLLDVGSTPTISTKKTKIIQEIEWSFCFDVEKSEFLIFLAKYGIIYVHLLIGNTLFATLGVHLISKNNFLE